MYKTDNKSYRAVYLFDVSESLRDLDDIIATNFQMPDDRMRGQIIILGIVQAMKQWGLPGLKINPSTYIQGEEWFHWETLGESIMDLLNDMALYFRTRHGQTLYRYCSSIPTLEIDDIILDEGNIFFCFEAI
ncbi:hypothetical protein PP187_gp074 [Klebsiella phage vB_KvM-Eowyn]|uniref:Uncharacterized protein n=1 Tax=Klebsiella phage vB_KvM-Eowyn TaxID=2762819 RepID=A0A7R8MK22_9CAUD|nr:hypothetical protein PP187_gp074 [Klebsiella phage vB_KvM-Eowyn]CAD5236063.1 hypothetical protein LLCLJKAH_00074 [Klebsiella phage vB_KvM-Eowyn]